MTTSNIIVLGFALAIVWWIWRGIRPNLQHLSDDDLNDFLANRTTGKSLKHTREHLLRCEECKERLDELTSVAQKMKPERWLKRRF
ncbi:MAG: hypothetical protein AAGJ93_05255 [Bacteroidota bacterium]